MFPFPPQLDAAHHPLGPLLRPRRRAVRVPEKGQSHCRRGAGLDRGGHRIRNVPKNLEESGPAISSWFPRWWRTSAALSRRRPGRRAGSEGRSCSSATIALGTRVNGDAYRKRTIRCLCSPGRCTCCCAGRYRERSGRSLGGQARVHGGCPAARRAPPSTCDGSPRWAFRVYQGYGLSETSPIIASNSNVPGNFKIGSSGRPFPWAKVSIIGEDGLSSRPGRRGEICVAGAVRDARVLAQRGRHPGSDRRGRLVHTGDLGYLDADGFLFVVGRIKSLLVGQQRGEVFA